MQMVAMLQVDVYVCRKKVLKTDRTTKAAVVQVRDLQTLWTNCSKQCHLLLAKSSMQSLLTNTINIATKKVIQKGGGARDFRLIWSNNCHVVNFLLSRIAC